MPPRPVISVTVSGSSPCSRSQGRSTSAMESTPSSASTSQSMMVR